MDRAGTWRCDADSGDRLQPHVKHPHVAMASTMHPTLPRPRRVSTSRSQSAPFTPGRLMRPLPPLPDQNDFDVEAQRPFGRTMPQNLEHRSHRLGSGQYTAADRRMYLRQQNAAPNTTTEDDENREDFTAMGTPSRWWIVRKIDSLLEKLAEALYDRIDLGQDPEKDLLLSVEAEERDGGESAKRFEHLEDV